MVVRENAKALLAIVLAATGAIVTALEGDQTISVLEWVQIGLFVVGSGGVTWWVTKMQAAKAIVAGLAAALTVLYTAVQDDSIVTNNEWALVALAGLAALAAVYGIPNTERAEN